MEANEIKFLIDKYLSGKATPEESAIIETWFESVDLNPVINNPQTIATYQRDTHRFLRTYIGNGQDTAPAITPRKRNRSFYRWLSAAVLLISLGSVFYLYNKKPVITTHSPNTQLANDVAPGGNKAILTLAGGQKILLTGKQNGIIASQGDHNIHKTADGKISYEATQASPEKPSPDNLYNSITTPNGGTYFITLSDGTKVWLNAASSIKYPVSFKGTERVVDLTGEAYFEVAKNKSMPFKVKSGDQTVEVLGTHFNVNSYANESAVKTTLLEGHVNVNAERHQLSLSSGEQCVYLSSSKTPLRLAPNVNLSEVMAWKDGRFYFVEANIQTVMRQLERWYDVEAVYASNKPSDHFNGKIPKDVNLSEVLKVLALSGVHFKIEGRKVIIN